MTEPHDKVLVIDASAVVALLTDSGARGAWVREHVGSAQLVAPDLLGYEVGNTLRRHEMSGELSRRDATDAYVDYMRIPVELYPHRLVADRAWEFRANLTIYDATYVALAELLEAPLVTLDARIGRAPGLRCEVRAFEA